MSPKAEGVKQIAKNRKAYHDYSILERFEAGVELFGTEVKSVRQGNVNLRDSFCTAKDGELFARGVHISPYEKGNIFNRDPLRAKRLLMHRREIRKLGARIKQDGLTLIPLSVYLKGSLVKIEVGLCKGKKLYDKRDAEASRDADREMGRTLRNKAREE
jgi:SsrA-binding protein